MIEVADRLRLFRPAVLRFVEFRVLHSRAMSWRGMFRPGMRAYIVPLVAGAVLAKVNRASCDGVPTRELVKVLAAVLSWVSAGATDPET